METSQVNLLLLEITRLRAETNNIYDLLNAQQKLLQMRNIQLDPELLLQFGDLRGEMERVHKALDEQGAELERLRGLVRTMALITTKLELRQVLNEIMDTFIEFTEAERGLIVLLDPRTNEMVISIARGMEEELADQDATLISRKVVRDVTTSGEPVITTNALEDERYSAQESIIRYNVRSIICVPLKVKEQVIGVVYADHRWRPELFGEKELKFLMAFANQAAVAIENARLFDDVQRRLAEINETRNFLDNIFASIASGVVTLDHTGTVMTVNRAAEKILGIRAEDSLGEFYTEIFPSLYEGFDDALNGVMQGRQQSIEISPVLPERGPVTLKMKLSPLIDADSQRIQGVTIVIDDLTEIRKHEETLRVVNTYLSEEIVSNIRSIDQLGLGGEDREISALFADVRGFTTFSEQLAPETLMSVINQYLSQSSTAIQVTEGIIDKFMGDAVLGLYNTQLNPQQDHAMQCVRAAIIMTKEVQDLHRELPPNQQLLYGIGIHTGFATIGNVGSPSRKEFTAIGEAVVYAKKLQECAQGGEIIISQATYERVRDRVDCELIERQLRGESEAMKMYKVLGLKR